MPIYSSRDLNNPSLMLYAASTSGWKLPVNEDENRTDGTREQVVREHAWRVLHMDSVLTQHMFATDKTKAAHFSRCLGTPSVQLQSLG